MRVPRRAAVVLATVALTGTVAACGGDDLEQPPASDRGVEEPALTDPDDVTDPGVPVAPGEDDVPEDIAPTS